MSYVLSATEVMDLILIVILFVILIMQIHQNQEKDRGDKNVTINEDFFQGHFPDNPVMPGALILETLAQAGSILILKSEEFLGKRAYIGGINKAKFRQKVVPGDVLKCHFEITKMKGSVGTALSAAYVDDKKVCECEFTFIVNQNA